LANAVDIVKLLLSPSTFERWPWWAVVMFFGGWALILAMLGGTLVVAVLVYRKHPKITLAVAASIPLMIALAWCDNRVPRDVVTAVHGPKRDYVGDWKCEGGQDFTIDAEGRYDDDGLENSVPITAFEGDDVVVGNLRRLRVSSPPHRVGDHFEMTADGFTYKRNK
jgi:hypothetical protein